MPTRFNISARHQLIRQTNKEKADQDPKIIRQDKDIKRKAYKGGKKTNF